ncbi:MAG: hypothetical protein KIT87_10640 [Anaerolineae bacterium]|nr:hypothetical protein [Anaerolineae bacterium]
MLLNLAPVRQHVATERISDVTQTVHDGLRALPLADRVRPGQRIAIACGSRGITCLREVIQPLVEALLALGAQPFLVPAMGSHGGGTAEGQHGVLVDYGLGDLGAPILSSMETVLVGYTREGMPVYFDQNADRADGVIVVNRIKEHTAFKGRWESGLMKILAVGLGKRQGAATIHAWGLPTAMPAAARVLLAQRPILAGIGIVENGEHQPASVTVLPAERIEAEEPALLDLARRLRPGIPFDPLDLLIVREIGKNISGTGMDLNVIGMWRKLGGERVPDFRAIAVLDLTPVSHGNANGVGYADLIPQRLRDMIDITAMYTNAMTAQNLPAAKLPITLSTDRAVVEAGLSALDPAVARVVLIRNTLDLASLWVSPALLPEVEANPSLDLLGPPVPLTFTEDGSLTPPS